MAKTRRAESAASEMGRREFLKQSAVVVGAVGAEAGAAAAQSGGGRTRRSSRTAARRKYNAPYTGDRLSRVAFPLGGIGAGMVCLEGTGALSHLSVRNKPDVFNEPLVFAAICVKSGTAG